jgi:hypothetical protein
MGSLLVDRENNRMGGRIDVEADDVFERRTRSSATA